MQLANQRLVGVPTAQSSKPQRTIALAVAAVVWIATAAVTVSLGGVVTPTTPRTESTSRNWVSEPVYVAFRDGERTSDRSNASNWVSEPAFVDVRRAERQEAR
jgi:hypothetical protein